MLSAEKDNEMKFSSNNPLTPPPPIDTEALCQPPPPPNLDFSHLHPKTNKQRC